MKRDNTHHKKAELEAMLSVLSGIAKEKHLVKVISRLHKGGQLSIAPLGWLIWNGGIVWTKSYAKKNPT